MKALLKIEWIKNVAKLASLYHGNRDTCRIFPPFF